METLNPQPWPGCFFFVVAPFCSCPASLVSRKFFAVGPGCAKCFFLLRSVGRRDLSAGPEQKTIFFCSGPGERQGKEKPRWKPARGQSKKKTPPKKKDFLLWPRAGAQRGFSLPRGRSKKNTLGGVFFCSGPVPASNGASPSLAFRRGRSKKKTPWVVFFFCSGPVPASNGASPSLAFRRGRSKKKTPWVVFFFLLRPRADAHSLTAGLGGDASSSPGRCFFFLLRPRPDRGGVFFLLWPRPDAHSLTVGWGDFGKARVVFFFLLRPRRVFLDNNKKCLGYYIGSKKTRRGHSKKKNTTSPQPSTLKGWGLGPTA